MYCTTLWSVQTFLNVGLVLFLIAAWTNWNNHIYSSLYIIIKHAWIMMCTFSRVIMVILLNQWQDSDRKEKKNAIKSKKLLKKKNKGANIHWSMLDVTWVVPVRWCVCTSTLSASLKSHSIRLSNPFEELTGVIPEYTGVYAAITVMRHLLTNALLITLLLHKYIQI